MLGTCMLIGDGALTPATSVLSALQGIDSISSKITQKHVIVLAVVLLIVPFIFQQCGTSKVGFFFSPNMIVWFSSNAAIGIYNIVRYEPTILKALSPHYIIIFCQRNGKNGWEVLGAVSLWITGAEAMFADLGHFTKTAIQVTSADSTFSQSFATMGAT
ncbi:potassium transporter 6-like [Cornus florida]|uniref:potassium transporter 6-like n=1 Tax=Cornus florida TaxID=4283 RepID=UPI002896E521|nr:potassium transporter 6-like [Cornus florida]